MFYKSDYNRSYFVAYCYKGEDGLPIIDNTEIKFEYEINDYSDITSLIYEIKKQKKLINCDVKILNYILLK